MIKTAAVFLLGLIYIFKTADSNQTLQQQNFIMDSTATIENKDLFISDGQVVWENVAPGLQRKIMAYDERVMVVKVKFEKGGVGTVHQHHHTQISHVESGVFEIEIDGVKKNLKAGDAFFIPPNVLHGAVCIEAGTLIDVFSPMREDFIQTK